MTRPALKTMKKIVVFIFASLLLYACGNKRGELVVEAKEMV